jgi:gliding motility-associated-like protein
MMKQSRYLLLLAGLLIGNAVFSQACLTDYRYRLPITITNSNVTPLTFFQVRVVVNTQALISAGKARIDGGDFRFTNAGGLQLPYWFDPATLNTTATEFWVKMNNIAPGANTLYMFYGNAIAPFVSSGDATFEFFDEFTGTTLDNSKWTRCGSITNVSLSGGSISLSSNITNTDGMLYSTSLFATDVIVEADVTSATEGRAFLGFVTAATIGYGLTMEQTTGVNVMKMSSISAGGSCQVLTDVLVPPAVAAGPLNGVWAFKWPTAASQTIYWPTGNSQAYTNAANAAVHSNNKRVLVGSHLNADTDPGTLVMDWLRVRKLATIDPTFALNAEQEFPVAPNPTNTGPYCETETIQLNAVNYAGCNYEWFHPTLGSISTTASHSILLSSITDAGTYTLQVAMPGCSPVSATTDVDVSAASDAGITTGSVTVCAGANSGTVEVNGYTGSVIRWEMANHIGGPWFTVSSTADVLSYANLNQTTLFRPVIKSSGCPEAIGTPATITVDNATVGGFVIGDASVCFGSNSGTLNLVYQNGNVNKWQQSTNNGGTWTDIISNSTSYSYVNLTQTTWFRAEVQNGTCPALFSAHGTITVNPLPVPAFSAAAVCEGYTTNFVNSSTIPSGVINSYQWNFGNGSSSITINPIYTYPTYGNFNVELTAVSDAGCIASTNVLINVHPLPIVDFNAPAVCQGTATNFQAVVNVPGGSVSVYDWDHDDGSTSAIPVHPYTYASAGTYNALLIATSNNGCVDSVRKAVEVAAPVNVSFIADSVCLGQSIGYVNTSSTGSPSVNYTWNFGNGATSFLTNPIYTYPATGTYTVTLQAQVGGATSCISSTTETVVIYEVPAPNFSFGNVCSADSASFTNLTVYGGAPGNVSYSWTFGDGNTNTLANPKHKYVLPTNYTVGLTATTVEGCSASTSQIISIYAMPTANFTFSNVCLHDNMSLSSTSTVSSGSLSYAWDFDDGGVSSTQSPIHLYAVDGLYDIELIVTTNNGCRDTIVQTVTVHPRPVVDYMNQPVCDGQTSTFSQQVTINSGSIVSYAWDFGDGSSSTSPVTTHLYLNPGTYNVQLVALSDMGCSHDTTKAVVVNPVPVPDFTAQDACIGAANQFTNASFISSGIMTYEWEFGDGGTSIQQDPSHTYIASGLYPVKLIATSGFGCVDSIVKYTEVFSLPVVNAGNDTTISRGDEFQLNGYETYAVGYTWTPATGLSNSNIADPIARPADSSEYTLTITDANGCQNSDMVWVYVENDFKLLIHNIVTPDGNGQNDFWTVGNIDYYPEALVELYNRWGEKVYETTAYQSDWQGTKDTDQLPDGSYYYVISFPDTDFHYKGSVTVMRNK